MIGSIDGKITDSIIPRYAGQDLYLGIDSSKTNTAIAIGTAQGRILNVIEIDGSADTDILALCKEQREWLLSVFKGANIKYVGIEDIITKKGEKEGKAYGGISYHQSRWKITAVFMSLIFTFQDYFNADIKLINNQSWKNAILPAKYRTREHKKGSKDWFEDIGHKYAKFKDDVTDACCIFEYLHSMLHLSKAEPIEAPELKNGNYNFAYSLFSLSKRELVATEKEFIYNKEMTLEQNAIVMANKNVKGRSYAIIDITDLTIDEIINKSRGKFEETVKSVMLVVQRVGG